MLNFDQITCPLSAVVGAENGISIVRGDEKYFQHVANYEVSLDVYDAIVNYAQFVGIGETLKDAVDTFKAAENETPG